MPGSQEQEQPPYARIVAAIRARIAAGELGPGARVPSTREITRGWGVAMATASKALSALRQEGLVEVVRGVGTVVRVAAEPARSHDSSEHEVRLGPPGERERRSPPEAGLTREAIVRAAISIVDDEGIDDFSMRRVATELRVSTMALYRHVVSKADLLSAMIDSVYHDARLPELPHTSWRRALETAMRWEWDILRLHPWVVRLTPTAGQFITPAVMEITERMMSVITAEGNSPDTALDIVTVLSAYTSGMATAGLLVEVDDRELDPNPKQWWPTRAPELVRTTDRARFSTVFSASRPPDIDRIFVDGMERLLDGMAPVINADG